MSVAQFRALVLLALLGCSVVAGAENSPSGAPVFPPSEPSFIRHVVPLFSRLGCNAGACHGKVKGENGFRLSLFGVSPAQDHASLTQEYGGRRVNLAELAESLLLLKPTGGLAHGGGQLISIDSPEYQILARWLEQGAALDPPDASRVIGLAVRPAEQLLQIGEKFALTVEARFSDGTTEDVTRLCRFEAINGDVVRIDPRGEVVARALGDTAIVIRFGAEPVVANVIVPGPAIAFPSATSNNFIDDHILAKLRRLQLPPAELCDDATFLRRAALDITGALPKPDEIRQFLASTDPAKRSKKIDELLQRPGYSALWATKFCDILKASNFDGNFGLIETAENRRFYEWLRARFAENTPYDELVERILTATSRDERPYEAWIDEVLVMAEENARARPDLVAYQKRRTLDLYWQRKDATGVKGAVQVAHAFLGLRMECAQCHRHPHDIWTQDDLLSFANFFNQLKGARYPDKKQMPEAIAKMFDDLPKEAKKLEEKLKELREKKLKEVVSQQNKAKEELGKAKAENKDEARIREWEEKLAELTAQKAALDAEVAELEAQRGRMTDGPKRFGTDIRHDGDRLNYASVTSPLGAQRSETFRLLGEEAPLSVTKEQDPRPLIVAWLRRPDNPFFARSLVNRVWAHYFGRGIVDPPDQLSPLNPASHPQLLQELAAKFVEHKYDLRWLHRTIAGSRTYQLASLSSLPPALSTAARRNFAVFQFRRLPAEVLVDAVNDATGASETYPAKLYLPENARALEVAGATNREDQQASLAYAFKIFGRPLRSPEVQCDCERDPHATIAQTLYLANHPRVLEKIYSANGAVVSLLERIPEDAQRIEELYLLCLSRLPNDEERRTCLEYVAARSSSLKAFQDVLWSLINTREFVLHH